MPSTISKDTPLAELTLRRYEKPSDINDRDLVRKICLSVGLLQPGDSRDVVVDVLYVLLKARKDKKELNSIEVEDSVRAMRKQFKLPMIGVAGSNIRRQLKRLKDLFLIENVVNNYRITEFMPLNEIFEEKIEKYYLKSVKDRVREYFELAGKQF